ncbi:MAG: hypothetical protein KDB87_10625 [Flavobacteriales bacterium]|nr:hypothetical protein [Flavobacteriales bacterium]MCB0813599.1 hypothetical protein [Flavobacteriales bacterium]HPJ54455.1 hypothetical protein [Flavobacteriales bacterium]
MRHLIHFRTAATWAFRIFLVLAVFHLIVVVGILAFDHEPVYLLWGGRVEPGQLLKFELFALIVNAACIGLVLLASGRIGSGTAERVGRWLMWPLMVLFILNTVGNLLATSWFERIMAAVTVLLALLCLRLAMGPDRPPPASTQGS